MNDITYPKLTVISGDSSGTVFVLKKKGYSCGRSESNDFVLNDSSVSSDHCELIKSGNSYILRDKGSTNGTIINGTKVDEILLKNNDIVKLGVIELLYDGEIIEEIKDEKKDEKKEPATGTKAGANLDLRNHEASRINEMKNISPFSETGKVSKKLYSLAIKTLIIVLVLVVIGLLVFLFTS
jgi:pSer/pThr/pTyr-binding forkhead associated (FHA) protein